MSLMSSRVEVLLRPVLVVSVGPPLVPSRMIRVRGCCARARGLKHRESANPELLRRNCRRVFSDGCATLFGLRLSDHVTEPVRRDHKESSKGFAVHFLQVGFGHVCFLA